MDINNLLDVIGDINERQKWLQEVIDIVTKDDPECIAIACICIKEDGSEEINTGYFNCDVGEKQLLATHIQVDAIDGMIKANIKRYLKIAEETDDV